VDLTEADAAQRLYVAATERLGGVDILVNNTGGPPPGTVDTPNADLWRAQIDTMLVRVIELTNLCVVDMKAAGWGRILTVVSSGIIQPIPNLAMSNTIRSALVGWNKSLSNVVASFGITANLLVPGRIHTQRVEQLDAAAATRLGKTVEEIAAKARADIPVGRYGTVDEFGSVGAFLVSDPARYVTGSVVRCDGGAIKSV
jgi:3-oxoacyl-[acyl-carrier protein] reductase